MDIFVISTIILAIWGAVGPLVGVRYGNALARRIQRERWIADNKKEEFRALLAGLNDLLLMIAKNHIQGPLISEDLDRATDGYLAAINTSIFISDQLKEMDIHSALSKALATYKESEDLAQYQTDHGNIVNEILSHAKALG